MKVSVIIPVKNGEATLERCLESISKQTIFKDIEIIILDSDSTDNSRGIALRFGALIIAVPKGKFNHGLTRNQGIMTANGNLIYFTVQDAWIPENDMLEKMAAHFLMPDVKGVSGHQAVPSEQNKNPLVWFKRYSTPVIETRKISDQSKFELLSKDHLVSLIAWDNVVAMYMRSALVEQPFVETEYAEDCIWSYNALKKGWTLIYDSSLVVYHYHHRNYSYSYKMNYALNYHFYKFFSRIPSLPPIIIPIIKATYHLLKNHKLNFKEKIYWIFHNYSSQMGHYFSNLDFLYRLKIKGNNNLDARYKKVCNSIPQGFQKK